MHPIILSLGRLLTSKEGFLRSPVPPSPFEGRILLGSCGNPRWSIMEGDGSSSAISSSDLVSGIRDGSVVTEGWHLDGGLNNPIVWTWLEGDR